MSEVKREPLKCSVEDGSFVIPCSTLMEQTDCVAPGFSKTRGIARWNCTSMTTLEPTRSFFGVRSKESPKGFLFNFCPFCGVDISAPFAPAETQAEEAA